MRKVLESPNRAGTSPAASTFSTARSSAASKPTRLAGMVLLLGSSTLTALAPATTWALVMI